MGSNASDAPSGDEEKPPERELAMYEWIVAALGGLIVLGAIGHLIWHALERDRTPPDIRLTSEQVIGQKDGFLVMIRVRNEGRAPAAELTVEGVLQTPDGVEISEATFDYLPPRSDRDGGLFFEHDPRGASLKLQAKSFITP